MDALERGGEGAVVEMDASSTSGGGSPRPGDPPSQAELIALTESIRREQERLRPALKKLPILVEVLRALPGVRVEAAKREIRGLFDRVMNLHMVTDPDDPFLVVPDFETIRYLEPCPRLRLLPANVDDLCLGGDAAARVTPRGLEILAALYDAGMLPTKAGSSKEDWDPRAIRALVGDVDAMLRSALAEREQRDESKSRRMAILENPCLVLEHEIDLPLLDAIFSHHLGEFVGVRTLQIAGIEITKEVSVYDLGFRRDVAVGYFWRGSDGRDRSLSPPAAQVRGGKGRVEAKHTLGE